MHPYAIRESQIIIMHIAGNEIWIPTTTHQTLPPLSPPPATSHPPNPSAATPPPPLPPAAAVQEVWPAPIANYPAQ